LTPTDREEIFGRFFRFAKSEEERKIREEKERREREEKDRNLMEQLAEEANKLKDLPPQPKGEEEEGEVEEEEGEMQENE